MNPIVLDDTITITDLFPFTLTRSAVDIRVGILTLREKWEYLSGQSIELSKAKSGRHPAIPANTIPTPELVEAIMHNTGVQQALANAKSIQYPWQIFQYNDEQVRIDYNILTSGNLSQPVSSTNRIVTPGQIFMEEGAKVEYALLNASTGPIYIGKNAEIMEGSMIRGPFALGEGAQVKMGAKMYGATTVGPYSVVGGEIKNSVIFGYSNKAHDGYLGDSVIGEWCNLGAGTSNSNLKNTAGAVKGWNATQQQFIGVGLKCGLLMGDYSRCAINTAFNTGTVTGVCCNIFGEGLTPKYIPSFSWGPELTSTYKFEKALQDISNWKKLKNHILSDAEIQTLKHIFDQLKM